MRTFLCLSLALCLTSPGAAAAADDAFTPLFNGVNLAGWQGDTGGYLPVDGELHCTKKGGKLYTSKTYADFVLRFDFKLTPGANNGLGIRTPLQGDPAYVGMELQILDNKAERFAGLKPYQYHGSVYGVEAAERGAQNPTGTWNTQEVICIGNHVKVTLNGKVITDVLLNRITPVDGRDHPGLQRKDGHIGFLGHGAEVYFRNISIMEVNPSPALPATSRLNQPPSGFTALFNGRDLSNWKGLVASPPKRSAMSPEQLAEAQVKADEQMQAHWSIQDGLLVYDGKGNSLCTAVDFADFEMYVDWLILPKGDSGIYLRGSPQVQIWDPEQHGVGSGGLYNNKKNPSKPLLQADRPIGEWNTFLLRMVGDEVWVWLNGELVVDQTVLENYWDRSIPIYRSGQLELQHHGNTLKFKNVFVRELPW